LINIHYNGKEITLVIGEISDIGVSGVEMLATIINMKEIIQLSLLIGLIVITSCSPKLGKQFYNSQEEIIIQQSGTFLPNGWNAGLMSANYPGILAIVNEKFIFDAIGAGSRPWMSHLEPFVILKNEINSVNLSEAKALNSKIITINTGFQKFEFYLSNADKFNEELNNWLKK